MTREYEQRADRDIFNVENFNVNSETNEKQVKKKILMLLTEHEEEETLRRRKEIKAVREAKDRARSGSQFDLDSRPDIGAAKFSQEMSKIEPFIIDISGHENGIENLVLGESTRGNTLTEPEKLQIISELFRVCSESVKSLECIILNGCYSMDQAQEIVQHVEFVIGINHALSETESIGFLEEFYYQIFSERNIKSAHEFGCSLLKRQVSNDIHHLLPELLTKKGEKRRIALETELASCDEATEYAPSNVDLWKQKARLLRDLSRTEEATEAYEKASSLAPDDPKIRTQQGKALVQLGFPSEAAIAYDQALKLEGGDYKIWWKKAQALVEARQYSEAVESYNGAIALEPPPPDNYVIFQECASVLEKLGEHRQSIVLYKKSVAVEPRYRISNYAKKQTYKKLYLDEDQSLNIALS